MVQGPESPQGETTFAHPLMSDPNQTTRLLSPGGVPGAQPASRSVRRRLRRTGHMPDGAVMVVRGPGVLGRGLRALFWLVGIIAVISLLLVGVGQFGLLPKLHNPFVSRTIDRSQPPLLLAIQDLSRFEAASGDFQVIIDVQHDKSYIPDVIFSTHVLVVAAGTVDAFVDFSQIGQNDLVVSADRTTVQVHLPSPQLDKPNIDHDRTVVYPLGEGIINKIGDLFSSNPNQLNELYQDAEVKLAAAATASGLPDRAADNTRAMLTGMLHSLGFTTVTVAFAGI